MRVPVGVLSGTVMFSFGFAHIMSLAFLVGAFFVSFGYLAYRLYSFISENLSDFSTSISSDILDFVSYTLNFQVIYTFATVYYFVFCSLTLSFLAFYFLSIISKFLPAVIVLINRCIKYMTGQ